MALLLALASVALALESGNAPFAYQAGKYHPSTNFTSATFELTGFGAAESHVSYGGDGALIYSPALSTDGYGYAQSYDYGKTWTQVLPGGKDVDRVQPVFHIVGGRYIYWATTFPGLFYAYSDDFGKTWNPSTEFHPDVADWTHLAGNESMLYMSSPNTLDFPLPDLKLGPIKQMTWKSTDRGTTWKQVGGSPTLLPQAAGGSCGPVSPIPRTEMILWGSGIVRTNGTVMFGVRLCDRLNTAISDDEGEHWRFVETPGKVAPYVGIASYYFNGNVELAEPLSQDQDGNIFATWVDPDYVLWLSKSRDGSSWSKPIQIAAPGLMVYHPKIVHHPTEKGRAGLAYYGSADGGRTWHGFLAETADITAAEPLFSAIMVNPASQPLQQNDDLDWDQGYNNFLHDLIEYLDVMYHPKTGDLVGAFTQKMCSDDYESTETFNASSCRAGWDFAAKAESPWQGFVAFAHHGEAKAVDLSLPTTPRGVTGPAAVQAAKQEPGLVQDVNHLTAQANSLLQIHSAESTTSGLQSLISTIEQLTNKIATGPKISVRTAAGLQLVFLDFLPVALNVFTNVASQKTATVQTLSSLRSAASNFSSILHDKLPAIAHSEDIKISAILIDSLGVAIQQVQQKA